MGQYNEATRFFAKTHDVPHIDLEAMSKNKAGWFKDEVHQKEKGLQQTAQEVFNLISSFK